MFAVKHNRFHQPVLGPVAMGRFILPQHHLLLPLDGIHQRLHVGCIGGIVNVIGDAGAVVHARQFPLKVALEDVVIVDAFYQFGGHIGLLLGEVDKPIKVAQPPGHLAHGVHVAIELVHHESGLADGFDVAVHRPRGDVHLPGQLVDGAAYVAGEEFHQAEELGYFGLIHNYADTILSLRADGARSECSP